MTWLQPAQYEFRIPIGAVGFCFLQNKKFKPILEPAKRPVDQRIQVVLIHRE